MQSRVPDVPWPPSASHYDVLGAPFGAPPDEIRRAYRDASRRHHPDKGGLAAAFARVQAAWEVLSDSRRRAAYDACAHDYLRHFVYQDRQRSHGGEGALLAELHRRCPGAVVPSCQLVVTCELCGRPATRDCSVCGMPFCSFCARRQHWRGDHVLHWPVVASPGAMLERLGRREMELRRLEDDRRLAAADPYHRTESQLRELRAFKEAAVLAAARPDHQVRYDPFLARLYLWTQTDHQVVLAAHLPDGRHDREVAVEVERGVLRVGVAGAAPAVQRALAGALEPSAPLEVHRTADGRYALVVLTKSGCAGLQTRTPSAEQAQSSGPLGPCADAASSQSSSATATAAASPVAWPWRGGGGATGRGASGPSWWRQVFVGDSDGARSVPPPYKMTQLADEVVLELTLPWWVQREDVDVRVGERQLQVAVRGLGLSIRRSYWWNSSEAARRPNYQSVVPEQSTWTLDDAEEQRSRHPPPPPPPPQQHLSRPALPPPTSSPPTRAAEKTALLQTPTAAASDIAALAQDASRGVVSGGTGGYSAVPASINSGGGAGGGWGGDWSAGSCMPPVVTRVPARRPGRCLTITLARPELTEEEKTYKKGVRQDNRTAARVEGGGLWSEDRGVRFFKEDEDTFGLEPLLQAASFLHSGGAWVVPRPWQHEDELVGRWVGNEADLPPVCRAHLASLRAAAAAESSASGKLGGGCEADNRAQATASNAGRSA